MGLLMGHLSGLAPLVLHLLGGAAPRGGGAWPQLLFTLTVQSPLNRSPQRSLEKGSTSLSWIHCWSQAPRAPSSLLLNSVHSMPPSCPLRPCRATSSLLAEVYSPLLSSMVYPVVMYGCASWTIKKAEHRRTDTFELWCWRRLLRVPWTARRSIQSILKEISLEYSLEGLMLKLKLQYFGHLMQRTDTLEKTLMLGKIEGRRKRG